MLTEARLQEKRRKKSLRRLGIAKRKARRHGMMAQDGAWKRYRQSNWLAELATAQDRNQAEADQRRQQALESRRANQAMSQQPKPGVIGRIKALFRGRGR